MTVTLVLRLLRGPLDRDELVGHAEIVSTGIAHPIRNASDVLAVARAAAAASVVAATTGAAAIDRSEDLPITNASHPAADGEDPS